MDVPAERTGQRILVVEDHATTRQILGGLLDGAGYDVDLAEGGMQAIQAAKRHRYDLVLMDLGLPDIDGYSVTAALRRLPLPELRPPVVALTVRIGNGEAARCRAALLDGYITKPFRPLKLIDEIRRWTSGWMMPTAADDHDPVWNRSLYREIADRLGPVRTEAALVLFEDHLVASCAAIQAASGDPVPLTREAHAFVSSAGMLGFAEFARVSYAIMAGSRDSSLQASVKAFDAAAGRVLDCLRHAPRSALS